MHPTRLMPSVTSVGTGPSAKTAHGPSIRLPSSSRNGFRQAASTHRIAAGADTAMRFESTPARLDRCPDGPSWQLHAESVVETIGPVRLPHGGSQLHEMFGRKRFLQFDQYRFCHGRLLRELLGKRDNCFFQIIVRAASRVIVERLDLLLGKSGPLTEGFVMMDSVMTLVDHARLQVRQLPQFGVQPAVKAGI